MVSSREGSAESSTGRLFIHLRCYYLILYFRATAMLMKHHLHIHYNKLWTTFTFAGMMKQRLFVHATAIYSSRKRFADLGITLNGNTTLPLGRHGKTLYHDKELFWVPKCQNHLINKKNQSYLFIKLLECLSPILP